MLMISTVILEYQGGFELDMKYLDWITKDILSVN